MKTNIMRGDISAELRQTAEFVSALIVCRGQVLFYPDSHPAVSAALDKSIRQLAPLIEGGWPLTLGITGQGLLFKEALIEPNNIKIREFTALLASFGIIAISFTKTVQPEDILKFNRIINRPRSEIWEDGGILHALDIACIRAIEVQAIDASVFKLTAELAGSDDGNPPDAWGVFVRRLLQGCFSSAPDKLQELLAMPPDRLPGELAVMLGSLPEEVRHQALAALTECYMGRSLQSDNASISDESQDKLNAFISSLDPTVCRDFIINIYNSSDGTTGLVERLLDNLPEERLQKVANAVAAQDTHVPDMILKLLQRLATHSKSTAEIDAAISEEGVGDKVHVLMQESHLEQFIPARYLETLTTILATDKLPDADSNLLQELRATFEADQLESKFTDIIDEIVRTIPLEEQGEGIRNNLLSQIEYFLGRNDFKSLDRVCRILKSGSAENKPTFFNLSFVQNILGTVSLQERAKFKDIRMLITTVGAPFIEPLIEKLATEENRSLRRFWFDCLGDLGEMVRDAALVRLNDGHWFVLRNLLVMLRNFNDSEVVQEVRKLTEHSHPKVRSEALRNLLHYQDPTADRLIMTELQHSDPARKLAAIQIAETSRNIDVLKQILEILDSFKITGFQLELKSAAVQTLAHIGNPLALPVLLSIISYKPLLHRKKHALLKIEVIRSLPSFGAEYVRPILLKIAGKAGDPLAAYAAEALKILDGAGHDPLH